MSADRLREAARGLRDHIEGLTTDKTRWDDAFPVSRVYADKSTYERLIVHPGVGLALADWLDDEANRSDMAADDGLDARTFEPAERIADLILGSAP